MAILVIAMPRRKYEITARMNERDYLHIVELALPPGDRNDDARKYLSRHSGHRPRAQAHHPAAGMVSALSCEPKRCTLATCSAWASGHFDLLSSRSCPTRNEIELDLTTV